METDCRERVMIWVFVGASHVFTCLTRMARWLAVLPRCLAASQIVHTHINLSENEMNNSLAAKLHQVERVRNMQQNGGVCFRFDSLLFTTSISMLGILKLEKNVIQNNSLIIPEINLLLN